MPRTAAPGPDIQAVWTRYIARRAVADRNTLVGHYAHLVNAQVARLGRKLPARVSPDEIRSAAFDGLIQAVQSYDPRLNTQFEIYCQRRIAGAVTDWLRSYDAQSRLVRSFERRRAYAAEGLQRETGRAPTPAETARAMGLSLERFEELARRSRMGREVHFSAMEGTLNEKQPGRPRRWEAVDHRGPDPSATIARELVTDFVTRGMSRAERLVIVLYYYEDLTMTEIGVVLDLSESRVSQIHKDLLTRLRRHANERLADELAA